MGEAEAREEEPQEEEGGEEELQDALAEGVRGGGTWEEEEVLIDRGCFVFC